MCEIYSEFAPQFQINQPVSTDTWVVQNWASQHIAINSTLTVNTAFNISGCAISFGPFGKIVVASNGHLTSTGTDFFSCGHPKGWRGIRVENGGMLTFSNGNRVEDAEVAIDIATNAPVVISGNTIWIEEYDTAKRRSAIIAKGFPGTDDNMIIELNHVFAGAGWWRGKSSRWSSEEQMHKMGKIRHKSPTFAP